MDEVLDAALETLDMLNNPTGETSKREYTDMRLRGGRSLSCGRRHDSSPSSTSTSAFIPTKENALKNEPGGGKAMLYCASESSKMYFRRQKHRPCPYDLNKRKPLNSLINPMGFGHCRIAGARVRSSDSYSDSRSARDQPMPLLFNEEYHDLPFRDGLMSYYCKTDKFPVPILSRSKLERSRSLEDLRESPNKPGKQVRFKLVCYDDNSNGTASSNGSNSLESPLSVSPMTSFFNVLKGEASIKSEIDSMSMLIEKLDVA